MKDSLRKMPGGGGEMQMMRRRGEEGQGRGDSDNRRGWGGHVHQSPGLYGTLLSERSHRFLILHRYILPCLQGPPYTVRPNTIRAHCHT